jgi:dUTP pyrophosphatase
MVRIKQLRPGARVPEYQSEAAAGLDLCACPHDGEAVTLEPGQICKVPLGLAMALPIGYEAQVRPRSGLASKHGITLPNSPGTIDADYRGELVVPLINLSQTAFVVEPGMRIAQMIIARVSHAMIHVADELDETSRGAGGFGSTGLH